MPLVAEPPVRVAPDLSRPPAFFEEAAEDPAPAGAFFWTTFGKLDKSTSGKKLDPYARHLCIYRHKEDAARSAREPHPCWTWDGLPPFHITPPQALGLARDRGFVGVVLRQYVDGEWIVLKTWDA